MLIRQAVRHHIKAKNNINEGDNKNGFGHIAIGNATVGTLASPRHEEFSSEGETNNFEIYTPEELRSWL